MSATEDLPRALRFIQRDWLSCNQLVLLEADGATLIDSGYVKNATETVRLVGAALAGNGNTAGARDVQGNRPVPLARVINTHLHSDHCGGNAALAAAFGCELMVPESSAAAVAAWDEEALTYKATGQRCARFVATGTIAAGETFRAANAEWIAHAAPGHDPESLIFHCPELGVLVSADALWEHGFGVIFPELAGESGFAEEYAVLELIEALAPRIVIPGHGSAFTDAAGAIARARSRLAAMASDPARHARSALKVLVKYRLLDYERETEAAMIAELSGASVMAASAVVLGIDPAAALMRTIDELVAQGQLRRDGDWLLNV
ncbi:MAG: MBL fold metallo-hydrolase [Burkholderiaceae bacterium]|nr:MBL fold metallo-hydrolase [Burkholderiaceae bacterium]